eukprot:gb/GECH01000222.1/.p1 GENE.gb/GECH01000222.1/~~gb/GECH01000222.1/.p1  ORF type:complete len:369 (+),score=42.60 gb/GECH01000222.1/:1-1107(+)
MGLTTSKLERSLEHLPVEERYFGLDNFGNTCYCNSVLQALYFCIPFRNAVLNYYNRTVNDPEARDTLLGELSELFALVSYQKKRTGSIAPRRFLQRLREENEAFRGFMQQDAHEFLNYLLNTMAEQLEEYENKHNKPSSLSQTKAQQQKNHSSHNHSSTDPQQTHPRTFVHDVFAGTLTNETRCICCERTTSRDEMFFDLSVDVQQNSSISNCLRNFSSTEMLSRQDKFFCEECCSLQEAQKSMRVKKMPRVLALHLKRFKYMERQGVHRKLPHRVAFPFHLRLTNAVPEADDAHRLYVLFAVVIHIGSSPNHGHYVAMVKSHGTWLLFDDNVVEVIEENDVREVFGHVGDFNGTSETGYILFYQSER